ncbi:MAG TPA: universal stress protein, partial [Gemmatimonadales bacterium]|nr:universal stress protein [Gemmatimonadales bacterium]
MIALKHILVATDFGEAADAALAYGRELARAFGSQIDVLHVADNLLTRGFGADGYVAACSDLQRDVEEAALRQLDALLSNE